jgi:GNAT superfamily N-acetyltransferase
MVPAVSVRLARPEEAEAVAALINAINSLDGHAPRVPMTAAVVRRDLLGPRPWAVLLVAARGEALEGFVTGSRLYDAERGIGGMLVLDLYVRPEARRCGIGRGLMAGLAATARADGGRCLWWGVDVGDAEALRFYEAVGALDEGLFHGRLLVGRAFDALAAGA